MGNDQAATLRKAGGRGHLVPLDAHRDRVIAVTGGKGGVGKSTVSVNLACLYGQRGARALAVDGDMGMADLNLLLGVAPKRTVLDLLEGTSLAEILIQIHGIHLLPGLNGSFRLANLPGVARRRLFESLSGIADDFDTLLIDLAAGIGETNVALGGAAGEVICVVTPEPLSMADAYACIKVLSQQQGTDRVFILPNQIRTPSEADEVFGRLSALVDRFLGIELVRLPAIPADPTVRTCAAQGAPLVVTNPDSPAGRALRQVARRLDALAVGRAEPGAVQRFLSRALAAEGGAR